MWEQPIQNKLIDQKEYKVKDRKDFVCLAVFKDNQFLNKVTKQPINNIVRVWM